MARPGQAQDEAMDAILASIRSMMAENESGRRPRDAVSGPVPMPAPPPPDNVSRLFAEAPAPPVAREAEEPVRPAAARLEADSEFRQPDPIVEIAMTRALAEARAEVEAQVADEVEAVEAARVIPESRPVSTSPAPPAVEAGPDHGRSAGGPLMSPHAGAAVSGAFDALASSVLPGSGRTIDQVVEDLLRPMLRAWLDDNLPPLVERLVRDEIERVSRGRR